MKYIVLLLVLLLLGVECFYEDDSEVVKLTADNFQQEVLDSNDLWLVEFYAPWCGHCKQLAPEFDKAAKGLAGFVKLGAVDMTVDAEAGKGYDIQGYPTIKWFGQDKSVEPEEFDGKRTSTGIIHFSTNKIKEIANNRIGNKKKPKISKEEEPKQEKQETFDDKNDDVIVLTDSNWETLLEQSKEPWFVEFYAPWCGHCKNLAPTWQKLATSQKGKINIAKVDATQNSSLGQRYEVKGYPSLKFFPGGAKSDSAVENYSGGRDLEALESFCAKFQPPKFTQLTNQQVYDEYCGSNPGLCIIAFLPPLFDSSEEQRQQYIDTIEVVANANRGKPFTFLWSEGGKQFQFEDSLNANGAGYPSVVALSARKLKYSNFRAAFNEQNLLQFVDQAGQGKGGFYSVNQKAIIKSVEEQKSSGNAHGEL